MVKMPCEDDQFQIDIFTFYICENGVCRACGQYIRYRLKRKN